MALDGETDIVVMQIREYQRALEAMDRLATIRSIREGLDDMNAGRGMLAEECFAQFRERHGHDNPYLSRNAEV